MIFNFLISKVKSINTSVPLWTCEIVITYFFRWGHLMGWSELFWIYKIIPQKDLLGNVKEYLFLISN